MGWGDVRFIPSSMAIHQFVQNLLGGGGEPHGNRDPILTAAKSFLRS
jgi:hypothetical protein